MNSNIERLTFEYRVDSLHFSDGIPNSWRGRWTSGEENVQFRNENDTRKGESDCVMEGGRDKSVARSYSI